MARKILCVSLRVSVPLWFLREKARVKEVSVFGLRIVLAEGILDGLGQGWGFEFVACVFEDLGADSL